MKFSSVPMWSMGVKYPRLSDKTKSPGPSMYNNTITDSIGPKPQDYRFGTSDREGIIPKSDLKLGPGQYELKATLNSTFGKFGREHKRDPPK